MSKIIDNLNQFSHFINIQDAKFFGNLFVIFFVVGFACFIISTLKALGSIKGAFIGSLIVSVVITGIVVYTGFSSYKDYKAYTEKQTVLKDLNKYFDEMVLKKLKIVYKEN